MGEGAVFLYAAGIRELIWRVTALESCGLAARIPA